MNKILLFDTSVATLNLGDEIIMNSVRKNINDLLRNNYVVNYPTHTPQHYWYQKIFRKDEIGIYKNADLKFVCGTNLLYTNMLRPLPGWNINILNNDVAKNSILLGVGCGVNSRNMNIYTKILFKKILSKKYYHSVRDDKTKEILEEIGLKAINTGCITLWGLDKRHCSKIAKRKASAVVFTLTYYAKNIKLDKELIDILKKNYQIVYFWPQCISDWDYFVSLGKTNGVLIIPANLNAFAKVLDGDIDYVGTRLHGGIYALQHQKRTIIIEIDYRSREMQKNYNINFIERNEIDKLEIKINSEILTDLNVNQANIIKWKDQFKAYC